MICESVNVNILIKSKYTAFYIAPKIVYSHWCKGMWTTLSSCASENGNI
jgi:hypothetical protein